MITADMLPALDDVIGNIPLPPICKVPLQSQGVLLDIVHVIGGQYVVEGELLASSSTSSHKVYAPISGKVKNRQMIKTIDNNYNETLIIELEGKLNISGMGSHPHSWEEITRRTLHERMKKSGILENKHFPAPNSVKNTLQYVLINACERESFLCVERKLINSVTEKVMEGIAMLQRVYPKIDIIICVDDRDKKAIRAVMQLLQSHKRSWRVYILHQKSGFFYINDEILTDLVLKGAFGASRVLDASEILAIYESVVLGKPIIDRIVAVGGSAIKNPRYLKARMGVPIAQLIHECGGFVRIPQKVIIGGALTGKTITDLSSPLTFECSTIIALLDQHTGHARESTCIRCGSCTTVCPVNIDPYTLLMLLRRNDTEKANEEGVNICIECGLCAHVCPSRIPLLSIIKKAKENHE